MRFIPDPFRKLSCASPRVVSSSRAEKKMKVFWLFSMVLRFSNTEAVVNSRFASVDQFGSITVRAVSSSDIPVRRSPALDRDQGPYCILNTTTNLMQTSAFVTSGFLVSNSDCRNDCDKAGCTQYRQDSPTSTTYTKLSQCVVAEAFHFALEKSRQERWCPYFDLQKSVFRFRGVQFISQWYWLGWGTQNDCMNAILCGPSSHYFDPSQTDSLAWCQPVPNGMFSRQCSNALTPCKAPDWADDMRLAVWTSHGFGDPDGCGVRLLTPAIIPNQDSTALMDSPVGWSVIFKLTIPGPFRTGSESIIFGVFLVFFLSVVVTGINTVRLRIFHRDWTLDTVTSTIESVDIQWYPNESRKITISFSKGYFSYLIDSFFASDKRVSQTLRSLGRLSSNVFELLLTSFPIHVGPVFVDTTDFVPLDSTVNPYLSRTSAGLDFILDSQIALNAFPVTITTAPPSTSTSIFIPPMVSVEPELIASSTFPRTETIPLTTKSQSPGTSTVTSSTESKPSYSTASSTSTTSTPMSVTEPSSTMTIMFAVFVVLTGLGIIGYVCYKRYKKKKRRRLSDAVWAIPPTAPASMLDVTYSATESWSGANYWLN